MDKPDIFEKIIELKRNNQSFVVATVTRTTGSAPGKVGFKMIVEPDSTATGTVGGGAIEQRAINDSLELLKTGKGELREYILSDKENPDKENVVPMSCQGKVWLFYEVYRQNPHVYVFGGGHVGQAMLQFLHPLKYYTILIDNRKEFANREINPLANQIVCSDYVNYTSDFNPPQESYCVILTHGHKFDYAILKTLYERKINTKYIGVIASKSKSKGLIEDLKKDIGNDIDLSILHTPIGLNIGGDSAAEIALSIAAEIQSIRYK